MNIWQIVAGALAILLIGIVATDVADEADSPKRLLQYQKGTYLGPADTPVSEEALSSLRYRGLNQGEN